MTKENSVYSRTSSKTNTLATVQKLTATPFKLGYGEAILIPNMLSRDLELKNSHINLSTSISGHGVFPPIVEAYRPVLLIDYMIWEQRKSEMKLNL